MLLFRTSKKVKRGAALLDEKLGPDWVDRIDTERVDLVDFGNCILGQLYGDYYIGAEALALDSIDANSAHGFTVSGVSRGRDKAWAHLNQDWVRLVNKRQLARSA